MELRGSIVALVTPFKENGDVDFDKLGELLDYHCDNNSGGIVILGTTGESSTLTFEEEEKMVEFSVKRVNKRVPLIVGSGSNETEKAVRMSKKYSMLGADFVLVITPYYNKTNESGLIKHFTMVADASMCPVIMYNVPGRTGMFMSIHALEVLSNHPNIWGIKEASGNMSYAAKVSRLLSKNFHMLSGNDDIIVPMMSIGAEGVISVLANIAPKQTAKLCALCLDEKYKEANKIQMDLLPLINNLFIEVNPIPVKEAMNYLGYGVGGYRAPLDYLTEADRKTLCAEIDRVKELIF